jgi:hypothetical protein
MKKNHVYYIEHKPWSLKLQRTSLQTAGPIETYCTLAHISLRKLRERRTQLMELKSAKILIETYCTLAHKPKQARGTRDIFMAVSFICVQSRASTSILQCWPW